MKSKNKKLLLHITSCILFMGIPLFMFPRPPEESLSLFSKPTQRDFIANLLMLILIYLNYYFLIPKLYFTGRLFIYGIVIWGSFLLMVYLPTLLTRGGEITYAPSMRPGGPPGYYGGRIVNESSYLRTVSHIIFLYLAVILFSILLRVRQQYFLTERARQQAELLSLKAQINPHFLFNTLNSIYSLAVTGSERTADAIIHLSQHMRYILEDTKAEATPVQKELDYISNYLDLQKMRLGDTATIEYIVNNTPKEKYIVPMLLIQFIENAFKHGVNPDKYSKVRIILSVTDELLNLSVFNYKVASNRENKNSGIGIENTKQRLNLLYPSRHKLIIKESETDYTVHLIIQL